MSDTTSIDYVEIPVTDLAETKAFYSQLFGWECEDFHAEYVGFTHGKGNGGFQKVDTVTRGGPLIVLFTDDLETMKEKVVAAGAEISKSGMTFPGGEDSSSSIRVEMRSVYGRTNESRSRVANWGQIHGD